MTAPARTRVLYVINDLARAGAETQLVELARRLDRAAFEPRIVMLKSRNAFTQVLQEAGIPVTALGRRGWWDFGVVSRLAHEVEQLRPDIVHAWLFLANLVSALAVRREAGRRLILSQRCSYEATAGPFLRRVARWSHRCADRVIVNSRAALEKEVRAGFSRSRIAHVPNGVGEATPSSTRAALGLPEGPLAVSVGQCRMRYWRRWCTGSQLSDRRWEESRSWSSTARQDSSHEPPIRARSLPPSRGSSVTRCSRSGWVEPAATGRGRISR